VRTTDETVRKAPQSATFQPGPWRRGSGQSVTGLRSTSSPNRPMQVWQRRSSGVSLHRRRSDPCDRNSPHQVSDCSALMMCHNEASTRIRIRTPSGSMSTYGVVTSEVTARQCERPNSHGRMQVFEGPTCCPSTSIRPQQIQPARVLAAVREQPPPRRPLPLVSQQGGLPRHRHLMRLPN
jgi:hypothetical protein